MFSADQSQTISATNDYWLGRATLAQTWPLGALITLDLGLQTASYSDRDNKLHHDLTEIAEFKQVFDASAYSCKAKASVLALKRCQHVRKLARLISSSIDSVCFLEQKK